MRSLVPGRSLSASQGWLNQTAEISPLPSRIAALITVNRRRVGRTETRRTSPAITASSSPKRFEIGVSPTACW